MNKKCSICGSTRITADRALAGRLVCRNCGNPIGNSGNVRNSRKTLGINTYIIVIFFITLLIIISLL